MGHATPWWDADGRCAVVGQRGHSSSELELIPTSFGHVLFAHALSPQYSRIGREIAQLSDARW